MNLRLPLLLATLLLAASAAAQPPTPTVIWEQGVHAVSLTYSSDGDFVAAAGRIVQGNHTFGRIDVFAAEDGEVVAYKQSHSVSAILGRTNRLSLSADLQRVASSHGGVRCDPMTGCHAERPGIYTWTFPDLDPLQGRTDITPASAVDFAPDGARLAVSYRYDNQGLVRVHDATTLEEEHVLTGHGSTANDVAYSPGGARVASVGNDGMLRVHDAAAGAQVFAVHHGSLTVAGRPISVAYSPDGSRIATSGSGSHLRVKVWDADTGALLTDIDGLIDEGGQGETRVAFTPNGMYLAGAMYQLGTSDLHWQGRIRFWDVETGEIVEEYADVGPPPYRGGVRSIAFSEAENHRFAYVVGEIGIVKLAETEMSLRDVPVSNEAFGPGRASVEVFPNPARGQAWISVSVPGAQTVRVEVLDVLGRLAARVHDGAIATGRSHLFALDAGALPAGVYLVRIAGETFSETRTVTVVR